MTETVNFIFMVLGTKKFWLLVLCSFTLVLMTAWRFELRDDLFWKAAETVGKKKPTWGN
jgi:hypothetical protein